MGEREKGEGKRVVVECGWFGGKERFVLKQILRRINFCTKLNYRIETSKTGKNRKKNTTKRMK